MEFSSPLKVLYLILFLFSILSRFVNGTTWCGKHYQPSETIVSPDGLFSFNDDTGPYSLRCSPRIQPYLEEDCSSSISVLVDIPRNPTTSVHLPESRSIEDSTITKIILTIVIDGHHILREEVSTNTTDLELQISLCGIIHPRKKPYLMTCQAEIEFSDIHLKNTSVYASTLSYLPTPATGSVTKLDRKTGALMTRPSGTGMFEPIFPIGFYTDFGYLAANLSILDEIKEQGFNTIHPVPPFDDPVALNVILDHMDELGLYLMYDMRHSYQNLHAISKEIERLRQRKSLLLWYTADEPDGPGDPLDATRAAYDLIYDIDAYHPVSLALNCADHFFMEYVSGADIILPDVYMIGTNPIFSSKYHTPCTKDFGCCGCDNCHGRFEDISERFDETHARLRALKWDRTKHLWAVTQAFGGEEFWIRPPTGKEWLVQAIISINHGARGIIPWIDPTPFDIKQAASRLAKVLPRMTSFLFDSQASFVSLVQDRVDMASWRKGSDALILAANMDSSSLSIAPLPPLTGRHVAWILDEGASLTSDGMLVIEPLGSAIMVVSEFKEDPSALSSRHDEL